MKFSARQRVKIKHQPEIRCVVVDPREPTDMIRLDGTPVGHYVRVETPKGERLGYHENSLEPDLEHAFLKLGGNHGSN